MKRIVCLAAGVAALGLAASAQAVSIPNGTFAISENFSPTISFTSGTFGASNGATFDFGGTGFFANVVTGTLNGNLTFGSTVGSTTSENLNNFFSFTNAGSTYNFSATSVTTNAYTNQPGTTQSATLYLLGTTVGSNFTPTSSSLTLQFNSTGGSAFSSSASFALPAAAVGSVPEPSTWAMFVGAFGLMGTGLRRRRATAAFA